MRIFHIADIHIDLLATRLGKFKIVNGENAIYKERLLRFKNLISQAVANSVDLIVIAGDLFNRPKPFPQELWDVAEILDSVPSNIQVIIIPGNHDEMTVRGCALQPLQNRRPNVKVYLEPTIAHLFIPIAIAPWGTPLEILQELRRECGVLTGSILITHVGTTLEGQHWTEVAGEIGNINIQDLKDLKFNAILMGHYHGQTDLGQNIWYPGSPECYNFGEASQTKGYILWDISKDIVKAYPFQLNEKPFFKTFTIEEFLDYKNPGYDGYIKIQGEATEQQRALILNRLENFQCEDYKLDLQSTIKMTKVFSLKGKSNPEILTNYLESKNVPITEALMELDREIEGEVL